MVYNSGVARCGVLTADGTGGRAVEAVIDDAEVRILGCLIEKEMTTPEYYPLSLNALTDACNQKTNRSPVVAYDEATVAEKLESLRQKGLAGRIQAPGSRVAKYLHAVLDRHDLSRQELALLCELMLRGPQTPGELRSRAERMCPIGSIEDAERALQTLIEHDPPLVEKLPRELGRKECRYAHLLSCGIGAAGRIAETPRDTLSLQVPIDRRVALLEKEVAELRNELQALKDSIGGGPPESNHSSS
jgi:hypothetical protein